MENLSIIKSIKKEPSDLLSSVEQRTPTEIELYDAKEVDDISHYLDKNHAKVDIKTEEQKDEIEPPVFVLTCYEINTNNNIKIESDEQLVNFECNDLLGEIMEDPLDVSREIEVAADENHLSSFKSVNKPTIKEEYNFRSGGEPRITKNKKTRNKNLKRRKIRIQKKYICQICHKIYKCKTSLNNHLRIHTGIEPFVCEICKKSFTLKINLDKHMKTHSGERPYVCDICKKGFYQKSRLRYHKLMHSDVKPFLCNDCNAAFTLKHQLNRHQRIHTDEKPYICEICNKAFKDNSHLVGHRVCHTGEKAYPCDICNKSFTRNSSLKIHKRIHTGERPYSCDSCNRSFYSKSDFNRHQKINHDD